MPASRKVYIIGFMGSGKTTAGKKLAAELGWNFLDLDKLTEEKAGKSIPEIFSEEGEDYFRKIESEVLKGIEYKTDTVISTGGGAPCIENNMDFMLKTGFTVYLKLTPVELCSRLADSKGERPLINNLEKDELLTFIETTLHSREAWYNKAELTVDGFSFDIKSLVSSIRYRYQI
jgi:shikimate kinase